MCGILHHKVTNSSILNDDVPVETETPLTIKLSLLEKVAKSLEELGRELNVSEQLHLTSK